ncbi:GNAT family N-acetyltransferase [Sphingomonas sp. SUN019]|uniref:GNAT family N-acetyltransferase n=1 Tax=Sphingomonas sp. SUN019 TaxID=2937788 RepID=UPI002164ED6A|nr:GNAT family N-acetyltransferase [Sphingomonas sp. SUN019]UVO50010.1 GNAT family N-acetyltransferase [Sphingomonas sp. SUN019]
MIFDPADPNAIWPPIPPAERSYIAAVAHGGARAMASNVRTRWLALASDGRVLPVTVNDGAVGDSYVCLPHSAYILYGLREMELVGVRGGALLSPLIRAAGRLLLAAGINRIVHIDNWLLSTNLHGDWDGADLPRVRAALTERFPHHILAIRSVDDWSSPALAASARDDDWVMIPSRQIWVTDNLARDWKSRNDYGNDRRLIARSGLSLEPAAAADAGRIAELYHQLYVGKYSALNPVFTPRFVAETLVSGLIDYRVARAPDGQIMAVAGLLARGDVVTPPVVGYDISAPRSAGLYRIASWLFGQAAMERGLRLHGSAGAAEFKRLRGAHGVIEYWAMYVAHLSPHRRAAIRALAALLERYAVPMMRRRGL